MFLPHLPPSELEEECFSKILPKVVVMFTGLLEEIAKHIGDLSSQNTELHTFLRNILQMMVQTLETLSACVRHVCALDEATSLESIRSLPSCILHILKDTFQHCKDSEIVYSGRLSLVGDLLQGLFREAYSLQKCLMELLDKISLENSASEEEISDIVTVIHSLLDICSVISNLDIALHANTWKFIIKQSVKYQSLVEEHLRHSDLVTFLCEDLLASLQNSLEMAEQMQQSDLKEILQCPEYKVFQKTTKMCRFFTNTLVHYIKEFNPFLSKFCSRFHQLYLQILSKFPPCTSAPSVPVVLVEELSSGVLVPMDAMLTQLLPMRPFVECVLTPAQKYSPELALPQCLLLVNVFGKLCTQTDETLCLWYDGSQFSEETHRLSIFEAVFLSFRHCMVERTVPVQLPGVMFHGQAQGTVSLHQHVCVHLCGCVAALPAQHFPRLERSLLGAVLQSDTQTAVLATDVWCFLARYGTAELCLHHVLFTAHLIKSCSSASYQLTHLGLLLRRLLFLMTPNHQLEFVECFLPSKDENFCLWSPVLLSSLCSDVRARVEVEVLSGVQAALDTWHGAGYRLGNIHTLNKALSCLLVVVRAEPLQTECMTSSLTIIHQLWNRMDAAQVQIHPSLQCTLRLLLSISGKLIKSIEPQAIVQGFSCLIGLNLQKCQDDLVLAILEYLASMGKVFVPADIQFQVLPRLSCLFSTLLIHESWLLHQHTLEAFATFAEATNHEEFISQSLTTEETKNKVVNFLSKIITDQQAAGVHMEQLRAEAVVIERHNNRLERREKTSAQTSVAEPCAKRPRQETCKQEEYERYLQAAESALRALQGIGGTASSLPQWVTSRLQALQALITQINSNSPHPL
ncbi:FIGNL1-interacting regulator of recombination and mitosis isoform X2 [Neoarius graeffei]|nr:FIGNL1-interacting regulator of recombination and mitosis isoform X2 [Neoarius graeffei]XP_060773327.1 FIGNL1-interacting regulator of recombination and mitosis isoform X2 [Neoarius graeffei]XP_060773328.1 FIGNL1-interacting regulator of recombination and mitosis isoform X2 [Neoarius graeffei]XP_060773329.1 FIGNL1-interacting regulator of recombination and mitosis isoform X2 [Neoarius graeffei]